MLNVKYGLQLLTHNNRLVIQLFLSSEIGLFEDKQPKFPRNPWFRKLPQEDMAHLTSLVNTRNSDDFMRYLGAQVADRVHILQFRSTHQYYRTVKYELNRVTSDGDRSCCVIRHSDSGIGQIIIVDRPAKCGSLVS